MRRAALVVTILVVLLLTPLAVALVGAWARGWTVAAVTTGSMAPGTPPGSLVVVVPTSPADVEVGDVISYRDDRQRDRVITHRVVEVVERSSGRFFTTQGDSNARPDGAPVPARAVLGEVRWRIAGLGGVAEALGRRPVQLALIAVPGGLLAASEVLGFLGRRRGLRQRLVAALAENAQLREALVAAGPSPS